MKFESIILKNFRNYEELEINIGNKNVFFGLNDVGKTNFLYALRFVFDKDIRKNGFLDTDYHNKNIDNPIEIIVKINILENECSDSLKLRAALSGALMSEDENVYIKLKADYDKKEMIGKPKMFWGGNLERLEEMKSYSYSMEIDNVFNVYYIDAYVDMYSLFKKNINILIKNDKEKDKRELEDIRGIMSELNARVSKLSGVKKFESRITPEYKQFKDEGISVAIKSEIAIKGLYSNLVPYIKELNTEALYPTAGEGRKKILTYSMYDIIAEEEKKLKINIFLVEEPENHLHKSMQIAVSKTLFNSKLYEYVFITTHSPYMLYEMDDVNLIRIYNENKINSTSIFYYVPAKFKRYKKILNRKLSEAIFADKVLLVEGPSELVLFEKVLSVIDPFYESKGTYILEAGGIYFERYLEILRELKIKVVVKTDNDLQKSGEKYSVIGFNRCNKIINDMQLPKKRVENNTIETKRELYNSNIEKLNVIRRQHYVFLSKVDLENDLDEVLHARLVELLSVEEPVKYLQNAKLKNMAQLVEKLTIKDCQKIYDSYNFECLKEVLK